MLVDTVVPGRAASAPRCELCGGTMASIPASYPTSFPVRSYECLACGHEQSRIVPLRNGRRPCAAAPVALVDVG